MLKKHRPLVYHCWFEHLQTKSLPKKITKLQHKGLTFFSLNSFSLWYFRFFCSLLLKKVIQGERGNLIATLQFFTGAVDPWCNKVTETSCDISLSPLGGENIDGTGNACNWSCYRNSRLLAVEPETPKLCITAHVIVPGVSGRTGFFRFKILA